MKNILPAVADKFFTDAQGHRRGASVLCFDEIQTVDVFAIVALSGIVSRFLSTGTVLVATSNRAPRDLNQDGMQKEIFEDLLARMEEHCENVRIGSEVDYRRHIAQNSIDQHQYKGIRKHVEQDCRRVWKEGHSLNSSSDVWKAGRFITLVNVQSSLMRCLYCSAAASVDDLFQGTEEGPLFDLESFQFETETENTKLRRDVFSEGNMSSVGTRNAHRDCFPHVGSRGDVCVQTSCFPFD